MALEDCIAKFKGKITGDQIAALEAAKDEGLTDEQAVRRVLLAAQVNVIDIADRARKQGAKLAPAPTPVSDVAKFQAATLEKIKAEREALTAENAKLNEELSDIETIRAGVKRESGVGPGLSEQELAKIDLTKPQELTGLSRMLFQNKEGLKRGVFGLKGSTPLELAASYDKLLAREPEIAARQAEIAKEIDALDARVSKVFSGTGKQTFFQDVTKSQKLGSETFTELDAEDMQIARNALDNAGHLAQHTIREGAIGVVVGARTRMDREVADIAPAFQSVRDHLKRKYGQTITLYRAEAPKGEMIDNKTTLNFASKKEVNVFNNELYNGEREIIEVEIDIDNIAVLHVAGDSYQEFIVINPALKNTFFQKMTESQNRNRAEITFNEQNQAIIRLTEAKDLTSFLHEGAHLYLEMLGDLVERPDANAGMVEDYKKILNYLGVSSREEIGADQHELFARSFEAYLREGIAPTAELQPLFSDFKGWFTLVYKKITQLLGVTESLSDDIRGVFDRLVASDEAISQSEDMMQYVQLFQNAEEMGISQEAFDVYKLNMQRSHQDAVDIESAKMIRAMKWSEQQWWNDERDKIAVEVRKKAEAMPVYRALAMLQNGKRPDGSDTGMSPFKLNRDDLIKRYGKDFIKRLPGRGANVVYRIEGGVDADVAAMVFGFESGDAMIKAMVASRPMEAWIRAEANRIMRENHPDPKNSPELFNDATKAVHNQKRGRILAAELNALRRKQREDAKIVRATKSQIKREDKQAREANKGQIPTRENLALVRAAARHVIGKKRIRDVNPNTYLQAERKAGRLAFEAMGKKDYAEAYYQKLVQIRNFEAYRAAVRAKYQSIKDEKYLKPFRVNKKKREKLGQYGVLESIDAVLDGINFERISNKKLDENVVKAEVLSALQEGRKDGSLIISDSVMQSLQVPDGVNWRDMTVEDFAGVRDVVKQLVTQADRTKRIKVNGEVVILEDVANEINASIRSLHKEVDQPVGTKTKPRTYREGLDAIGAALSNPGLTAKLLDKDDFGVITRKLVVPLRRAVVERLMPMQEKAGSDMTELYLKYFTRGELQMFKRKDYSKLGNTKLSREDVLSIALHQGSESNQEAFFGGIKLGGELAYKREEVGVVLKQLTKREWEWVQAVWDYLDSYWPALSASEKERRGISPERIEAKPFTVITSDGHTMYMRGGYMSLRYDSAHSSRMKVKEFNDYITEMGNGVYLSSNTRAGASYNRTKHHGEVVALGLQAINAHLSEVTRDIAIGNEINYINKILNTKKVRDAFNETGNGHHLDALVLWASDSAVGELPAYAIWDRIVSAARTNFTMSRLLFNFRVGFLQFAGAAQTAAIVGKRATAKSIVRFASHPANEAKFAFNSSAFMESRYKKASLAFDRDIGDATARIHSSSGSLPTYTKYANEILQKTGFSPIYIAQGVTDIITWNAAYTKGRDRKNMDHPNAVLYADSQVQVSQTSGLWTDRSNFERGSVSPQNRQNRWMRLWATLMSFMVSRSVNAYIETKTLSNDVNLGSIIHYAGNMFFLLVVDAYLVSVLYDKFDDDDEPEDKAWQVAKETVLGLLAGVPGVRDIESAKYGSGNTPIGTATNDIFHVVDKASEGDFNRKFWRHSVNLLGILTGAPSSAINRTVDVAMSDDPEALEYILGEKREK